MAIKKRKPGWIIGIIALVIITSVVLFVVIKNFNNNSSEHQQSVVKVEKVNIIKKAMALGAIEAKIEIAVKSKISGVVGKLYADVGDYVEQGEPLLEVKPDPTPIELAEGKRNVERKEIDVRKLKNELDRQNQLKERGLISDQDFENIRRLYDQAVLEHQIAIEQLELLEKGKVRIANTNIETVIKAPITGYILEKSVNVGDPVVPLTSYQAGTELMKMADMEELIFRGTIDEIDVGKIKEGMPAKLEIGALPGKTVEGVVSLISLKAKKEDNTTVFPVEIELLKVGDVILRAGFSANANIIIAREDSILAIPERVVTFRNDSAFVQILSEDGSSVEKYIETGLSDAIKIEVKSGLQKGQKVLEKKERDII
jgi:HlyD family secretion protein